MKSPMEKKKKKYGSSYFPYSFHISNFKILTLTILDHMQSATDRRMQRPKPICPLNFFEVGDIKIVNIVWRLKMQMNLLKALVIALNFHLVKYCFTSSFILEWLPSGSVAKHKWATTLQNQQNEYAPSEDSDQPGHLPSLISLRCPHEESLGP